MRKAQINTAFIYLLSIILIAFAGFLVTKFIFTFSDDVESRASNKIYSSLERDFTSVYRTYGSEKSYEYVVSSDTKNICFVERIPCIDSLDILNTSKEELKIVVGAGDNTAVFDENGIISSKNIGNFKIDSGCFCVKPNNKVFSLLYENRRNEVYIDEE